MSGGGGPKDPKDLLLLSRLGARDARLRARDASLWMLESIEQVKYTGLKGRLARRAAVWYSRATLRPRGLVDW